MKVTWEGLDLWVGIGMKYLKPKLGLSCGFDIPNLTQHT